MKKVTFCGHSKIDSGDEEIIRKRLYEEVEKLILGGTDEFLLGGYGQFDRICASTVAGFKEKYPHIRSVLVIPYLERKYDTDLFQCKTSRMFLLSKKYIYLYSFELYTNANFFRNRQYKKGKGHEK